jgi:hypothetical protein
MTSYASITELKLQIDKTGSTGTGDPANLQLLLDASTDAINSLCNRPDGFIALAAATARTYNGEGGPYQWIDECVEITLVEVKDSPTDARIRPFFVFYWVKWRSECLTSTAAVTAIMVTRTAHFTFHIGRFTTRASSVIY